MSRTVAALACVLALLLPASPPAVAADAIRPVTGQAHVQNIGWMTPTSGVIGTTGRALRMEAIRVPGPVRVTAHVQNIGWMAQVDMQEPNVYAGTVGKALRLEAIKIVLAPYWDDAGSSIEYRCHVENIGWMAWVRDGAVCGTTGKALRLEAVEIRTVTRNPATPAPTPTPTPSPSPAPTTPAPTSPPPAPAPGVVFGVTADTGMGASGAAVLSSIGASNAQWVAHLGDLSYQPATGAQWCAWAKARISQPIELLPGNHEAQNGDGPYSGFTSCLPDRMGAKGNYAAGHYYIDNGPVRYIGISPNIALPTGTRQYTAGSAEYDDVNRWVSEAQARGQWVVVGMHIPCLTLGLHQCEASPDITNLMLAKRVDLIVAGHNHDYERTYQITGTTSAPVVVDRDSRYVAGAGSVQVVVGNGGQSPRALAKPVRDPFGWGAAGTMTGWLKVTATDTSLMGQLIRTDGAPADGFIVARG